MAEASARILLVDDEESIQTLLAYPLRKEGYEVVVARDGREGLDEFAGGRFDLHRLDDDVGIARNAIGTLVRAADEHEEERQREPESPCRSRTAHLAPRLVGVLPIL